jgi:hypothetical protein
MTAEASGMRLSFILASERRDSERFRLNMSKSRNHVSNMAPAFLKMLRSF